MSDLRYVLRRRGVIHAAFVFAQDAQEYIDVPSNIEPFDKGDFTIEDAASGRRMRGLTSHGRAILDALDRAEERDRGA